MTNFLYEKDLEFAIDDPMVLYQNIMTHFKCPAHNIKVTYILPMGIFALTTRVIKTEEKACVTVNRSGSSLYWMTNGTIAMEPHQTDATVEGVKATSRMTVEWIEKDDANPATNDVVNLIHRVVTIYNEEYHVKYFVWYPHQHEEQKLFASQEEIHFK